jgi:hypothetical protein
MAKTPCWNTTFPGRKHGFESLPLKGRRSRKPLAVTSTAQTIPGTTAKAIARITTWTSPGTATDVTSSTQNQPKNRHGPGQTTSTKSHYNALQAYFSA